MNVILNEIVPAPSVRWPLPDAIRRSLADQITDRVEPSADFINRYGSEINLIFRISFMPGTSDNKIKGPTISERDNRIEYVIFLPFGEIIRNPRNTEIALEFLLRGVCFALESLGVDASRASEQEALLIRAALEASH